MKEAIFDFFAVQKDLKNVKLCLKGFPFGQQLTFHILEKCTSLRQLSINHFDSIEFSTQKLTEFMKLISNLESLTLGSTLRGPKTLPEPLTSKLALEVLSLEDLVVESNEELLRYILHHCSNLKALHLWNNSEEILQQIFRTMV